MTYVAVICMILASISGTVAADMTHEEAVVRTAYAKFSYASEEGVIGGLAVEALTPARPIDERYIGMTTDQRFAAARVSFKLTDFVVGDVSDILDRNVVDFISLTDEYLSGSVSSDSYTEPGLETHWNHLDASWQTENPQPPEALQFLRNIKLADFYQLNWRKPRPEKLWERYASCSVTVTFQGKSHGPYKALFIFGHDGKGNESIEVDDAIVPGLFSAVMEHLFPDGLVITHLRKYPVVQNWLKANQISGPSCSVGQGDVCCDLVKLKCGPGSEDVAEGLSRPFPDPSSPIPDAIPHLPDWWPKPAGSQPGARDNVGAPVIRALCE
jgi:hypothetical protein